VAALSTVRSVFGGGDEPKMVSPDCEMTWRTRLVIQAKRSLPDDQPTSFREDLEASSSSSIFCSCCGSSPVSVQMNMCRVKLNDADRA
jgi:hypothetical protein